MRKIIVHMHMTLDGRIADDRGEFWEPFPWGETEMAYLNEVIFRRVDTVVLSRVLYEAIVPWWDGVASGAMPSDAPQLGPAAHEFARLQARMTKVVFSRSLPADRTRTVIKGDLATPLATLKRTDGADIWLGCGPRTLAPLAASPGLIDEYFLVQHPAVIHAGPRLFDGVAADLALELVHAETFSAGAIALRYRTTDPQ